MEYTTLADDTSSGMIKYSGTGWREDELPRLELYNNHTVHHTATRGDAFSVRYVHIWFALLTLTGRVNCSSVQLFGSVGSGYGEYAIRCEDGRAVTCEAKTSLDGENQGTFNASWFQPAFRVSRASQRSSPPPSV